MNQDEKKLFGIDKLNVKIRNTCCNACRLLCRIQTVDGKYNPKYFKLLTKFKEKTSCPIQLILLLM